MSAQSSKVEALNKRISKRSSTSSVNPREAVKKRLTMYQPSTSNKTMEAIDEEDNNTTDD